MTVQVAHEEPMAWEDYEALGEQVRGEYIDGTLVVSPFPSRQHQSASHWVLDSVEPSLRAYVLRDGEYHQAALVTSAGEVPGWPGMTIDLPALLA